MLGPLCSVGAKLSRTPAFEGRPGAETGLIDGRMAGGVGAGGPGRGGGVVHLVT